MGLVIRHVSGHYLFTPAININDNMAYGRNIVSCHSLVHPVNIEMQLIGLIH